MQQYILIPEIPVIIRKIAPDGRESSLTWSTHNIYNGPSINLTFKENSNG
jgi:hypothetical protein